MANFKKIPLLSFIACALTVGGIFGAWVFGDPNQSTSTETNMGFETLPEDYWQFDNVYFTFNANSNREGTGLSGTFEDSGTTKSTPIKKMSGLDYNKYNELITSDPVCNDDNYVFSYWAYYKDDALTHYNFDVGFEDSVTLYAQYVPKTNPALYLYNKETGTADLVRYMFENPAQPGEYMANNILVDKDPGERDASGNLIKNQTTTYRDKYLIKHGANECWIENGHVTTGFKPDTVYKGTYNVFFRPEENDLNSDWKAFGEHGHTWFQRQYNFKLLGNPSKSWAVTDEAITLGYVSEVISQDLQTKTTTYKAEGVVFTDEAWREGNVDYRFKPGDTAFPEGSGAWPDNLEENNSYVNIQIDANTGNKNYILATQRLSKFDVTVKMTFTKYKIDGGKPCYNFTPTSCDIILTPCNLSIKYYESESSNTFVNETLAYGSTPSYFETNELNHKAGPTANNIQLVNSWTDKYTHKTYTINNLRNMQITGNLNLYPSYDPEIAPYATHNYYNGHNNTEWVKGHTKYVYDTGAYEYDNLESFTITGLTASSNTYTVDTNSWYESFDSVSLTKEAVSTRSVANGAGEHNYYVKMTKTTSKVVLPSSKEITDSGEYVVYQTVSANATYSYGDETHIVNNNFEEVRIDEPETGTLPLAGTYMFHIKNKSVVGTPSVTHTTYNKLNDGYLYLQPGSNWKQSNARFAAYFFGNGEKWVSMTKHNNDLYYCAKQSGYSSVIFCRMNPNAAANNWNNRWNQTGNLTIPTNGKNHFINPNDTWDGATTAWQPNIISVETPTSNGVTSSVDKLLGVVKLEPNTNWKADNAWFGAYFWDGNNHSAWRKMLDLDRDGVYVCDIPNDYTYTGMKFVRFNVSFSSMSFDYYSRNGNEDVVWNDTDNLTVPTGSNNKYTLPNEAWSNTGNTYWGS